MGAVVDLETERAALEDARLAAREKLDRLSGVNAVAADEYSEGFIDAVVAATREQLQRELTVFGRIDDYHPWRIGLFGIDRGGEQLVVDWRARFAEGFYQATSADPMGLDTTLPAWIPVASTDMSPATARASTDPSARRGATPLGTTISQRSQPDVSTGDAGWSRSAGLLGAGTRNDGAAGTHPRTSTRRRRSPSTTPQRATL
ncbi:MAG TPA: hypothetical protein VJM33_15055 [Microthrixaceae bacterium]|nr:hypothetical protein [Microthrixaceae bacterium]